MTTIKDAIESLRAARERFEAWEDGARKTEKLADVLRKFSTARDLHDELDEERKKFNAVLERLNRHHIPEHMREEGVSTLTLDDIKKRFTISQRYTASIPNKDLGYAWLRDHGHGDLITETVNASKLASFAKDHIQEKGEDLPPDLFTVSLMDVTSVTKVK